MKRIVIAEDITATLTDATAAEYERECADIAQERDTEMWLANPANYSDPCYSDIFKDVYGIRPHWLYVA